MKFIFTLNSNILIEETKNQYKKNIEMLEEIINSFLKNTHEQEMLKYFLQELIKRFKKIIKELNEADRIGYYELIRSTYEFSLQILFILSNKELVLKKMICYDYTLNFYTKKNIEKLLKDNSFSEELKKYFNDNENSSNLYLQSIEKKLKEIDRILKNKNYSEIKKEFSTVNKKIHFVKFYNCFCNNEVKSLKDLAKYLNKLQSYETLYLITSAISHGENLLLRDDFNLIITTTHELNFIVCEIIRKLGLYYCNVINSYILENKIKSKLGKNYSNFYKHLESFKIENISSVK